MALLSSLLMVTCWADDFKCPPEDGTFADPNNCIKYYECTGGEVEKHWTCPIDPRKQSI